MIQEVKCFKTELESEPFSDGGGLHEAEVEADVLWSAQDTASSVTENFLRSGRADSRSVPPIEKLFGTSIGISTNLTIVLLKSNYVGGVVIGRETRSWQARADNTDTTDLPSAKEFLHGARPVGAPAPALAKRKLI